MNLSFSTDDFKIYKEFQVLYKQFNKYNSTTISQLSYVFKQKANIPWLLMGMKLRLSGLMASAFTRAMLPDQDNLSNMWYCNNNTCSHKTKNFNTQLIPQAKTN